jgi:hypothetical protein
VKTAMAYTGITVFTNSSSRVMVVLMHQK